MMVEIDGVHLWADLRQHYWQATMILLVGGLIGVLFIIVLRRPLCVESDLPFPESVASAEIVKAGEKGSEAPRRSVFETPISLRLRSWATKTSLAR